MNAARKSKVDNADVSESGKISRGFECLVHKIESENDGGSRSNYDYDFVIVGSGYGGSIAAERLSACRESGKRLSICLLERGNEYLPGSFPSGFSEAAGYLRFSIAGLDEVLGVSDGLFDFRLNTDMSAIVGSGIGGGSLINAGVMEAPDPDVFDSRWPGELESFSDPEQYRGKNYFDIARKLLGASQTIKDHENLPKKFSALGKLAADRKDKFRPAHISVAMHDRTTASNLRLDRCIQCGDCVTGCNFGAKESLDTNLLDLAALRGVELYHGATVERIERIDLGKDSDDRYRWRIVANYTHKQLRQRQAKSVEIVARRVILAAGTFGSTEVLKRSECDSLPFSPMLGHKFSGNGDMIASAYEQSKEVNAVARYECAPGERKVGPTITGIVEADRGEDKRPFVIEELAIPNTLHRFFEELVTTAEALRKISQSDDDRHENGPVEPDPFAIDRRAIEHTAVMAILGDDGARGELDFGGASRRGCEIGSLNVKWPKAKDAPVFAEQIEVLRRLCDEPGPGGSVIPSPFWQFLPDNIDFLAESKLRGPLLTVHPLGGCPMGKDAVTGVVDHCGRVYDDRRPDGGTYSGLVVLDGAIVPTALEINPALTIAALSLRAMDLLMADWNLERVVSALPQEQRQGVFPELPKDEVINQFNADGNPNGVSVLLPAKRHRSVYRKIPGDKKPKITPTEVQLLERMGGEASFSAPDGDRSYYIEISLRTQSTKLSSLITSGRKRLQIDNDDEDRETASRIRVFELDTWEKINDRYLGDDSDEGQGDIAHQWDDERNFEKRLDEAAIFSAPLSGRIDIFNRKASSAGWRRIRAIGAWLFNRGLRDIWQALERKIREMIRAWFSGNRDTKVTAPATRRGILAAGKKKFEEILALSSRAGEIRTLEYELYIDEPSKPKATFDYRAAGFGPGATLCGTKYLTYSRRANPWRQLMELHFESFPGKHKPVLSLDLKYLARQAVPLFRITRQQDQPSALADLASLLAYTTRFLLLTHVWSFRQPDEPSEKTPQRYPGQQRWLPDPVVYELSTGEELDGEAVKFRLTRYPRKGAPPMLAMHGYSISGSMFAHPRIVPNAATYFHERGYDVWILDLRTSGASRTALHPWTFEEVAFADIPLALQHVYAETGQPINVLAHCMSAAMLSMAILKEPSGKDRFFKARQELPKRINCLALSQVGPRVFFSPANIFRAYLANYLLPLMPTPTFQFRPEGEPTLLDRLIDRVLSTLPYPDDEFDRENPPYKFWKKVPHTRTRHRADFLYGRDFSIKNVSDNLLDEIDDIFGFLNIRTISQTIHFARWKTITTRYGYNEFVSRGTLKERWKFNTLSVHGYENDLADVATIELNRRLLEDADVKFEKQVFPEMGHMDCIIGTRATRVFARIDEFFRKSSAQSSEQREHAAETTEKSPARKTEIAARKTEFVAQLPTVGPHIGRWVADPHRKNGTLLPVTVGSSPGMISNALIVVVPVRVGKRYVEVGKGVNRIIDVHNGSRELMKLAIPDTIRVPGANGAVILYLHNDHDELNDDVFDAEPYELGGVSTRHLVNISLPDETDGTKTPSHPQIGIRPKDIPGLARELKKSWSIVAFCEKYKDDIDKAIKSQLARDRTELESCFIDIGFAPVGGLPRHKKSSPKLSFALASCQYPAGLFDSIPAYQSYCRIADQSGKKDNLSFLLLVGDQVYVDATAGLFDLVSRKDKYRRPYQLLYRDPHVRKVMRRLPTYNMLDDHEIDNNWEPIPGDDENNELKRVGSQAFLNWQDKYNSVRINGSAVDHLWYDFKAAGIPFFVLDSRTDREHRTASNFDSANIMRSRKDAEGDFLRSPQFADLKKWFRQQDKDSPKFIVSPAIPFPRSRRLLLEPSSPEVLRSDRWDGYPNSHENLIRFLLENEIRNVVFLSGDEHLSMVSEVTVTEIGDDGKPGEALCLLSIHSSGLYAPFPFANGRMEDFELDETYPIDGKGHSLEVQVATSKHLYPGDGFAIVRVYDDAGSWRIEVEFSRAGVSTKTYSWKVSKSMVKSTATSPADSLV